MAQIVSTYRLQFHKQFPLKAGTRLVPYLKKLGISHIYASPLLQTRAGSTHGYDVVDPTQINSEVGTEADLEELCAALRGHEMGLILDIVPNHMALSAENPWWMEVLERGASSRYTQFFDLPGMVVRDDEEAGKLVLPVLGTPVDELLAKGEISLVLTERGVMFKYWDLRLPLALRSYKRVLELYAQKLLDAGNTEEDGMYKQLRAWQRRLNELGAKREAAFTDEEGNEIGEIKAGLFKAVEERAAAHEPDKLQLQQVLDALNGDPAKLKELLAEQHYEMADLASGLPRINYRRFFDVNELGGLRVEDPQVFEITHGKILEWVEQGKLDGLRIDHIDGLAEPTAYLNKLQDEVRVRIEKSGTREEVGEEARREAYIIVEKILTGDEVLPLEWPIKGTTGYEAIHALRPVHVTPEGLRDVEEVYRDFAGRTESFLEVVHAQKRKVLSYLFGAETASLGAELVALAAAEGLAIDKEAAGAAITAFSAHLPVYRTYVTADGLAERDRELLQETHTNASEEVDGAAQRALDFMLRVVLLESAPDEHRASWVAFITRWQQYTGPAMAKGLEDTTFYVHMPLLPMNEVGSGPDHEGMRLEDLHAHCAYKQAHYPHGMNALSTHDTKRSEDARARLHVLSEMPGRWREKLHAWAESNRKFKVMLDGAEVPDRNEEYMLYQTLLGELALGGGTPRLAERMQQFATKALREAKVHSTWYEVNHDYEQAVSSFIEGFLHLENEVCVGDITAFECELAFYGAVNSLAQLVLKNTLPGVPDTFQGQEMWDFSLVDPDNRHSVNLAMRQRLLDEMLEEMAGEKGIDLAELLRTWRDGRIKMYVTLQTLRGRMEQPDVYLNGEYLPLEVEGEHKECVFAFARRKDAGCEVVIVPRQTTRIVAAGTWPVGEVWGDTRVVLPVGVGGSDGASRWMERFSGKEIACEKESLKMCDTLLSFSVAVLQSL